MKLQSIFKPFYINKRNDEIINGISDITPQIYGFYHIYAFNDWESIVESQIRRLRDSGLYGRSKCVYVSVIYDGCRDTLLKINSLLGGGKFLIAYKSTHKEDFEFPILEHMQQKSEEETFLCYYFHTKGASHSKDTLKWYTRRGVRTLDELRGNSGAWRRMMEYWIFDKYKLAISCLMKGYMAYGAMIYDVNDTLRYFGGNFWWSTSEFIRTREKISGLDRADRYKAEGWLLKGPNISYYCPFYCSVDLTGAEIPVECYDSGFSFKGIFSIAKFYMIHLRNSVKRVFSRF